MPNITGPINKKWKIKLQYIDLISLYFIIFYNIILMNQLNKNDINKPIIPIFHLLILGLIIYISIEGKNSYDNEKKKINLIKLGFMFYY